MAAQPLRPLPHLSYAELTTRYKTTTNAREKSYWHVIWLMSHPEHPATVTQAAAMVGYHHHWARILVHRYNTEGPDGLIDQRQKNVGQAPLLTSSQQDDLSQALLGPAPDGGLWTGIKVAHWIHDTTGHDAPSDTTGLNYLHTLGFTLQRPRPHNSKAASPEEQTTFKKNFRVRSAA
jgi:transposase